MEKATTEFTKILNPDELKATMLQLDTAVSEVLAVGKLNETQYADRVELAKRARELQTEVQLAESEAIIKIEGQGKDAYGIVGGRKVFLTNDTARDAYRREASRKERTELADVEGKLAAIDAQLSKIKDDFTAKAEALHAIQAKARLQSALLEYLA